MAYKDERRELNCQLLSLSVSPATKHQVWSLQCIMIGFAMRSPRMWASCPHTLPPYRLEGSLSLWMWNIPEPRCERYYNRHGRSDESRNSRSVQVSRSSCKECGKEVQCAGHPQSSFCTIASRKWESVRDRLACRNASAWLCGLVLASFSWSSDRIMHRCPSLAIRELPIEYYSVDLLIFRVDGSCHTLSQGI